MFVLGCAGEEEEHTNDPVINEADLKVIKPYSKVFGHLFMCLSYLFLIHK